MELNQLHYFIVVAQTGNITKASSELYVTQSAVSRSISRLESELGTKLFDRDGGRLTLNETGEEFLQYAVSAIETVNQGVHSIKSQLEQEKLYCLDYGHTGYISNIADQCQANFPIIDIQVKTYEELSMEKEAIHKKCDLILTPEKLEGSYILTSTYKEKWCVIYNEKYQFSSPCDGKTITREQLLQEPIAFFGTSMDRDFLEQSFHSANIVEVSNIRETAILINRCKALGFIPVANFSYLLAHQLPISALKVEEVPCERYMHLYRDPNFLKNKDRYDILSMITKYISEETEKAENLWDELMNS